MKNGASVAEGLGDVTLSRDLHDKKRSLCFHSKGSFQGMLWQEHGESIGQGHRMVFAA